jgi:hypothetical protein
MAMKIIEKWAAGIYNGKVQVAKGHFKQTAKMFVREGGRHYDDLHCIMDYVDRVTHASDMLHDTAGEALDALHNREMRKIQNHRKAIEKIQDRLSLIDDFEISP